VTEETNPTRPSGILEPFERDLLTDIDRTDADRNQLLDELQERLYHALLDVELLYLTLRDEDIEAIFAAEDDYRLSRVRVSCQHALALLFLGMETNGDMTDARITDALAYAGASRNRELTADIDIIRSPMAPVDHRLQRLEKEGLDGLSDVGLETLLYDPDIDPERLAEAFTAAGLELSTEEARAQESPPRFERLPHTVITSVEVRDADVPPAERD
jgi:hypothetical protein